MTWDGHWQRIKRPSGISGMIIVGIGPIGMDHVEIRCSIWIDRRGRVFAHGIGDGGWFRLVKGA